MAAMLVLLVDPGVTLGEIVVAFLAADQIGSSVGTGGSAHAGLAGDHVQRSKTWPAGDVIDIGHDKAEDGEDDDDPGKEDDSIERHWPLLRIGKSDGAVN
jgi:hypothetical protein